MSTAQLILFLRRKALAEGRVRVTDDLVASDVLRNLEFPWKPTRGPGRAIAQELLRGEARSEEAKAIRSAALRSLLDYDVFVSSVDELGYIPQNVRAALSVHHERLRSEELGSDGNCILMDIEVALKRATRKTRAVAELLISGMGPQQIGELFGTNGSRLVGRAMKNLCNILEGGHDGKARHQHRA